MTAQKRRHIPKIKSITYRWTDRERLAVVLSISAWLEKNGEENALKGHMQVSPQMMEDFGVRLRMLALSSSDELERDRYDMLNGNPAKYN